MLQNMTRWLEHVLCVRVRSDPASRHDVQSTQPSRFPDVDESRFEVSMKDNATLETTRHHKWRGLRTGNGTS